MSLRIRTIARLTGVREATLRAWERRYGFPRPARGENNYRVYSRDEVEAVRRVAQLLQEGFSASEAIEQVRRVPLGELPIGEQLRGRFWSAVAVLDTEAADKVLDDASVVMTPTALCDGFLMPLLREMSDRLDVAREHLASALVRQRLRALVLAPGPSTGPRAVLACPAGETHEGGLLGLGVHLKAMGWRLAVLGADTPAEAIASAVKALEADVVALSVVMPRPAAEVEATVAEVVGAVSCPVAVGGPAAKDNVRRVLAAGAHFVETAQDVAEVASARL
ncbi:MAG TPA: MerR family transcriptional regulator, partial [Myxococcaceae bacterium]|nr:MerR family transcriptional regulator [Myxococcaceae bacterium]